MTTDKGFNEKHRINIPHEVVGKTVLQGASLMCAWREYLGMSQQEVAENAGISKYTYIKIENNEGNPRKSTLEKIAAAMRLNLEQILEN